uniref:Uncharacterized protein n=1 Tax=Aegilops tauschii subsp. strangulata TaxID=200361 RepID=A0A453B526_AEGTS
MAPMRSGARSTSSSLKLGVQSTSSCRRGRQVTLAQLNF